MRHGVVLGVVGALLVILALNLAGCGKSTTVAEAAKLVGTWVAQPPKSEKVYAPGQAPTLLLNGDGKGVYTSYPDPHPRNVKWFLKKGKLVMGDQDGSEVTTYDYTLKGTDELTLTIAGNNMTFRRYTKPEQSATDSGP